MGSKKLSFGICGFGFMGRTYFAHLSSHPRARVAAVCSKNNIKRADQEREVGNLRTAGDKALSLDGVNVYEDVDDLIADESVDVIAITLPTPMHADITVQALESGRHVICEKPMALRLRQCDRMIRTAEKAGRTLMIAQCVRFWPQYERIKQIVDEGGVGHVNEVPDFVQVELHFRVVLQCSFHECNYPAWLIFPVHASESEHRDGESCTCVYAFHFLFRCSVHGYGVQGVGLFRALALRVSVYKTGRGDDEFFDAVLLGEG